jgi:hypothetical protein
MLYEAETFARLVENNEVVHPGLAVSRITAKLRAKFAARPAWSSRPMVRRWRKECKEAVSHH